MGLFEDRDVEPKRRAAAMAWRQKETATPGWPFIPASARIRAAVELSSWSPPAGPPLSHTQTQTFAKFAPADRVVHLAFDDETIRSAASAALAAHGFSVRCWRSADALLRAIRSLAPGCLLLDARQPERAGLRVQQQLIAWNLMLPLVMLTSRGDVQTAVGAVKTGVVEILEDPLDQEEIAAAVSRSFAMIDLLSDLDRDEIEANKLLSRLTARELDVLKGLTDGLPNKTIAYDLGISPRTVEVYRANIMEKLGARSLSAVLRIAFAAKLD